MTDYRVTIVGRGLAGLACAVALADTGLVHPDEITTVDPLDGWLGAWTSRLERLAITHLRSSTLQHPDSDVRALERYIAMCGSRDFDSDGFLRYPSTALFRAFCDHLVLTKIAGINHHRATVTTVREGTNGIMLGTDDGSTWRSKHVVLASNPRMPKLPTWALDPRSRIADTILHTDELQLNKHAADTSRVAILGGGNTAAGLAVTVASSGAKAVLLARHPLSGQRFDATPGWMSATVYDAFNRVRDPATRLRMANAATPGATIPPRLLHRLRHLAAAGPIQIREGVRVSTCRPAQGQLSLKLSDGSRLAANKVWLATGSVPTLARGPEITLHRPMAFLDRFPMLDEYLRVPGTELFILGALARATMGPTAGNLHGQRHAAARIAAAVTT